MHQMLNANIVKKIINLFLKSIFKNFTKYSDKDSFYVWAILIKVKILKINIPTGQTLMSET